MVCNVLSYLAKECLSRRWHLYCRFDEEMMSFCKGAHRLFIQIEV
jgi:hypothetical protein